MSSPVDPVSPGLPGEIGRELARLGRVAPPGPGVLETARERLWAAVAAEMLATGDAGDTGSRRAADQESPRQARRPGEPDA